MVEVPQPPAPDGQSYEEYGRSLNVHGIDPKQENIDRLHVWHLFDDADILHKLLLKHIEHWSQLRALIKYGGASILDVDDEVIARATAAAHVIETACNAWRIGRGKPVSIEVFVNSGYVSDKFLDELGEISRTVNGDARQILDALESRRVNRWHSKNTDGLRDFFEEQGHLTNETPPLSTGDIRSRAMAACPDALRAGILNQEFYDRLVGAITN